jgi:hypothetical protein
MGWVGRSFKVGALLILLLLASCGNAKKEDGAAGKAGTSIAGDYGCTREGDEDAPTYGWELREDGTFVDHSPPDIKALATTPEEKIVEGTWTAQGDSGKFTSENQEYPFTIQEGRLVFTGGKFVCFKAPR